MVTEKQLFESIKFIEDECGIETNLAQKLRKFLEQERKGHWISCSERPPEKNGLYFVTQLRYSLDDIDHKRPPLGKEVDYVEYQDGWCGSRIFDVIA